jgi:uncharacterized protein (TIGR02996 family)
MTDGEALLAAVIDNPDDDAVRLVYADWLEDEGDRARAEFIRTQIEREGLAEGDPRWSVLKARETELLTWHAQDWQRHLPERARGGDLHWITDSDSEWYGFRRGFIQGAAASSVDDFFTNTVAHFALDPITHLYMRYEDGKQGRLNRLATSPEFMQLVGLRFGHYELGDPGVIDLCRLPRMPRLRRLWLGKNQVGDRGLKALARWPGLGTVEDLNLGYNDFQSQGIKALIASPYLTKLKQLNLRDLSITLKTKKALQDRFGGVVEV